jgi:hypothetical protein
LHAPTVYRIAQCISAVVIALRILSVETPPGAVAWLLSSLEITAVLLLAAIVRSLGGNIAGAVSLLLISLSPEVVAFSSGEALRFFCLAALVWLLATRSSRVDRSNMLLCFTLAALIAIGSRTNLVFVVLSPIAAFAWLLGRYVPRDSIRPYRALLQSLRIQVPSEAWKGILIITVAPLVVLVPSWRDMIASVHSGLANPRQYPTAAAHLLAQYFSAREPFTTLLLIGLSITLWWFFVSVQSGSGLSFSITAIPLTYLASAALSLKTSLRYGLPAHPILIANLVAFLGLWLRGRANKRVLDSTRD